MLFSRSSLPAVRPSLQRQARLRSARVCSRWHAWPSAKGCESAAGSAKAAPAPASRPSARRAIQSKARRRQQSAGTRSWGQQSSRAAAACCPREIDEPRAYLRLAVCGARHMHTRRGADVTHARRRHREPLLRAIAPLAQQRERQCPRPAGTDRAVAPAPSRTRSSLRLLRRRCRCRRKAIATQASQPSEHHARRQPPKRGAAAFSASRGSACAPAAVGAGVAG